MFPSCVRSAADNGMMAPFLSSGRVANAAGLARRWRSLRRADAGLVGSSLLNNYGFGWQGSLDPKSCGLVSSMSCLPQKESARQTADGKAAPRLPFAFPQPFVFPIRNRIRLIVFRLAQPV